MVFLLPYQTAHAASPTVTLSTLSSGVFTAVTSATVGTTLVITGSGFSPAKAVTITTAVGSSTVNWLTAGSCTTSGGGTAAALGSGVDSLVVSGCLTTAASGDFRVSIKVPNLPGGANTISTSDGTNTATSTLTVTSKVAVTYTGNNFGFPEESITPSIALSGFASGEPVTVTTSMWTTASFSCTTGASVGTFGSCTTGGATAVADTTGGSKTITATGQTSGLSATTTFTVNPWAAFYNSAGGKTTYSFLGSAPTSVLVEAHGLAAGTVGANSITLGGIGTSHTSVTIGASGAFAGAGAQLVVAPTAQVPFGSISAVIGGTTFNYASGNIALGAGTWGGALISSIAGSTSSTGVVTTDAGTYKPGTGFTASTTSPAPAQNQIAFFGIGFVTGGGAIAIATPTGATFSSGPTFLGTGSCTSTCDANGAVFATAILGDTPWSTASAPTTPASYPATVTQTGGPANVLSPSFGIANWVVPQTTSTVDYTTSTLSVTVHGFSNTETLTLKVGGQAMVSGGTCVTGTTGTCSTAAGTVPDLAGGVQTVSVSGALSGTTVTASTTATGAVSYDPIANFASGQTLSINSGGAGQTTIIRTGNGYGVHGLLANTAYTIVWNAISGSINVGTFTSTATGGIPIPGVQFGIPSDSSGLHILDIQAAGATALYGGTVAKEVNPSEAPFSGADYTAYGDMLFNNVALLAASPSVAAIGAPETLTGSGLAAGGAYVVALGTGAGTVSTSAAALATFTSTSTGAVPAGVAITLTDTPSTYETGTVKYFSVQTTAHFGVITTSDAYAQFVLASSAGLNMTVAPNGHAVLLTAHALNANGVYNIVFNYLQSPIQSTSFTGTTVGVIAPNSVGQGSATFNVPATAASGTYVVQLTVASQGTGGAPVGTAVLDAPLSLTVGSVNTQTCNTTNCLTAPSAPSVTTIGSNKAVQTSFTNTSNSPVTAIVYAVVHNALGQTVSYSTATITANAGSSATAYNVLFGLAPGTYSVSIFATSTSGTAISSTSTVSVTI